MFANTDCTVVGPNKGTQIREFFPYLDQKSEILDVPLFDYKLRQKLLIFTRNFGQSSLI